MSFLTLRGVRASHTRNCDALGSLLLTCATTALCLIVMWRLIGATPRGQPWTSAGTLPHGHDGLSTQRMAVWWTFREPFLGRHVPHELLRNTVLNLPLILPATACYQRNYVVRYSRFKTYTSQVAESRNDVSLANQFLHFQPNQGLFAELDFTVLLRNTFGGILS